MFHPTLDPQLVGEVIAARRKKKGVSQVRWCWIWRRRWRAAKGKSAKQKRTPVGVRFRCALWHGGI